MNSIPIAIGKGWVFRKEKACLERSRQAQYDIGRIKNKGLKK